MDPTLLSEEITKIKAEMGKNLLNKPEAIQNTIIEGKLSKIYEELVLTEMEYVLGEEGIKVGEYLAGVEARTGEKLKIEESLIWLLGEAAEWVNSYKF